MAEFIKIGRRRIRCDQIRAIDEERDGTGTLHYVGGGIEVLSPEDLAMCLEWVDADLTKTPKADKARADREKAEEEAREEARVKAETEAAFAAAKAEEEAKARAEKAKAEEELRARTEKEVRAKAAKAEQAEAHKGPAHETKAHGGKGTHERG